MHSEYTRAEQRRLHEGDAAPCCRTRLGCCHRPAPAPGHTAQSKAKANEGFGAAPKLDRQVSFSSDLYPFVLCGDFSLGELRRCDPWDDAAAGDALYPVVAGFLGSNPPRGPLYTPSIATPPDAALHVGRVVAVAWSKSTEWDADRWAKGAPHVGAPRLQTCDILISEATRHPLFALRTIDA